MNHMSSCQELKYHSNIIIIIRPKAISTSYNILGSMKYLPLLFLVFSLAIIMPAIGLDANYWLTQTASDYGNGSYSLALQDIDEYLNINSSDVWAWNFKANLLIKMKRYLEAVDSFDQIIQIDSSNAQAYNDRALILSGALKQDEEALDSLDKALQINPNNANTWYNKGIILEKLERYNESLENYGKAATLDSSLDMVWYRQGYVLAKIGSYNASLLSLEKAIELSPKNAEAWNVKGLVLMELNNQAECSRLLCESNGVRPLQRGFPE